MCTEARFATAWEMVTAAVVCKGKSGDAHYRQIKREPHGDLLSSVVPGTEPGVLVCTLLDSQLVLSPVTARPSLRGCLLSLKARDRQWIIICACRCCRKDQFMNNSPSHVVQTKIAPQLLLAEPVTALSAAAAEPPAARERAARAPPTAPSVPSPPRAAARPLSPGRPPAGGGTPPPPPPPPGGRAASKGCSLGTSLPFRIRLRIDRSSRWASLIGHEFKEQILIWTLLKL